MANKHAQESDRAMVGPPGPSSLSRSTFCPQQLSHKKTYLGTSPRRFVPDESLSCFRAPIKATHQAIGTGGTVIHFEEQCSPPPRTTFKLTNLPSPSVSIILLFASSNLSLSLRLLRTVLVPANLSRGTHFFEIFLFFFLPEAEINACAGRETQIKHVVLVPLHNHCFFLFFPGPESNDEVTVTK